MLIASILLCCFLLYRELSQHTIPRELEQFSSIKLVSLDQFQGQHAERHLWGTYRPGLYFGMRMRNPKSPLLGLMWVDPAREDPLNNIRHEAQQRDGLQQYGWAQHDGESFGVQHLHDGLYNITTSWAKNWSPGSPGCGDLGVSVSASTWAANHAAQGAASGKDGGDDDYGVDEYDSADVISYNELVLNRGAQRDKRPEKRPPPPKPGHTISLFLYVANEDGSALEFSPSAARQALSQQAQHAQQAVVRGSAERLGSWALHMSSGVKAGGPHSDTAAGPSINYVAMKTPHFHNLTALVRQVLYRSLYDQHISGSRAYRLVLPDRMQPGANLAVLQITAQLPLHVDLSLLAGAVTGHKLAAGGQEGWLSRLSSVRGEQLQRLLARRSDEFASRFDETFGRMDSQQLPAGERLHVASLCHRKDTQLPTAPHIVQPLLHLPHPLSPPRSCCCHAIPIQA